MTYDDLDQLIGVYFNEASDYWGNTIEELVRACASGCTPEMINAKVADIDRFKRDHAGNLGAALEEEFGSQFVPTLWGRTAESFLDGLKRLLLSE
ncbi:contact-dependent growth inhibition system immunity protein [Paraburkholderia sp. BR14320]|uniref:contact-dependent growth inhibition system immunity protein n=1 Tax=unclassified Paraburkholderia TaxID=2615204 RepID=UPI0034CFB5E4